MVDIHYMAIDKKQLQGGKRCFTEHWWLVELWWTPEGGQRA